MDVKEKKENPFLKKKSVSFSRHSKSEGESFPSTKQRDQDFSIFAKRLNKKLGPEEYEALFAEVLSINDISPFNARMSLLLKSWGEASPRHALDVICDYPNAEYWVDFIFSSWAEKNPEAAASYYEESEDRVIRGNYYALSAIASRWALHSPDLAWEWLHNQKGKGVFSEDFESSRNVLIDTIAKSHNEKIPQLLEKLDQKTQENLAYVFANNWPSSLEGWDDWINTLPDGPRGKAEAGRIMAVTEGSFLSITEEVSRYDREMQSVIARQLAFSLLRYGGNDFSDRIEWLLDRVPEQSHSELIGYHLENWFQEDNKDAREWIDNLPEGKKEKVIEMVNGGYGKLKY